MNGAPANPMSGVSPSSRDELAHGLGDEGDVLRRQRDELVEVGRGADRVGHDGPDPGDDVEVDADGLERHDDVAEEDGRVDAVAPHGLQRDLGDEVGAHARLEHRDALTDGAVLRQRTPGLAHEPHRRPGHRLAARSADEVALAGVWRGSGRHRSILPRRARAPAPRASGAP